MTQLPTTYCREGERMREELYVVPSLLMAIFVTAPCILTHSRSLRTETHAANKHSVDAVISSASHCGHDA